MVGLQRRKTEVDNFDRIIRNLLIVTLGLLVSCSGSTGLESSHLRSSDRSSVAEDSSIEPVEANGTDSLETAEEEQIEEELIAEPPVILSGSWLTCMKEVEGQKVSCEYFESEGENQSEPLVRGAARFIYPNKDIVDSSKENPEQELKIDGSVIQFDLPEDYRSLIEGEHLLMELVLERSKTSSMFKADLSPLLAGESMTIQESDRIELGSEPAVTPEPQPVKAEEPKETPDSGETPEDTVLHVPDLVLKEYTKLHIGDGNLGGWFARFFNRDCSSGQTQNLTKVGTTLTLRFKVESGSRFDQLKISEYCGVDASATADLLDGNGQIIESKSLNSSGDPREFKDLGLGEGEYALRVTIGSVAGNPDDLFIHKILATYTGTVTFESPASQ